MINYNELRDGQAFYSNGYKKGYEDAMNKFERPQGDLISRSALKKAAEELVAGGAERLKDYYENGSKSEENEWIGGVYDVWELIINAPPVEPISDKQIKKITDLLETEWGYEGIREDVSRILRGEEE